MTRGQWCMMAAAIGASVVLWRASTLPPRRAGFDRHRLGVGGRLAQRFAELLLARDYATARDLMTPELREAYPVARLGAEFERIVPRDWEGDEVGAAEVLLRDWPGRHPGDVALYQVPIAGTIYGEAVTVVVAQEGAAYLIREIEFGRP